MAHFSFVGYLFTNVTVPEICHLPGECDRVPNIIRRARFPFLSFRGLHSQKPRLDEIPFLGPLMRAAFAPLGSRLAIYVYVMMMGFDFLFFPDKLFSRCHTACVAQYFWAPQVLLVYPHTVLFCNYAFGRKSPFTTTAAMTVPCQRGVEYID